MTSSLALFGSLSGRPVKDFTGKAFLKSMVCYLYGPGEQKSFHEFVLAIPEVTRLPEKHLHSDIFVNEEAK